MADNVGTGLATIPQFGAALMYSRFENPMQFIEAMGKSFSIAGVCGVSNASEGQVLALACMCKGMDPFEIDEDYHLMNGRLSMRADSILAKFNEAGGTHRIIERSPERAAIELTKNEHTTLFSFTWEEAQEEPYVYSGKDKDIIPKLLAGKKHELTLSPKYATPRSRMQMLWSRVSSDAVRAVDPKVVKGKYTPEEIEHMEARSNPAASVTATPIRTPAEVKARQAELQATAKSDTTSTTALPTQSLTPEAIVDAQAEPMGEAATVQTETAPFDVAAESVTIGDTDASTKVLMEIELTITQAGLTIETVINAVNKKNGTAYRALDDLPEESALTLLENLRAIIQRQHEQAAVAGAPTTAA